jgi:hypothetical protein
LFAQSFAEGASRSSDCMLLDVFVETGSALSIVMSRTRAHRDRSLVVDFLLGVLRMTRPPPLPRWKECVPRSCELPRVFTILIAEASWPSIGT